jgi:hypothetical protein
MLVLVPSLPCRHSDGGLANNKNQEASMTQWKLVNIDTSQPIQIGDELVTFRGERVRLTGMAPPHKPEASGKLFVEHERRAIATACITQAW